MNPKSLNYHQINFEWIFFLCAYFSDIFLNWFCHEACSSLIVWSANLCGFPLKFIITVCRRSKSGDFLIDLAPSSYYICIKPDFPTIVIYWFWYLLIGYYADPEMQCQGYHVCLTPPNAFMDRKTSFLCPNGTIFSQSLLTCDWWYVYYFLKTIIEYIYFLLEGYTVQK